MPRCCLRGRNPSPRIVFIHTALIIAAPIITTHYTARNPLFSPLSPRRCARSQYSPLLASAIIKLFSSLISADLLFDYTIFPARPIQASTFLAANRSLQAKARAEKPIMRFQSSKVLIPIFFGQLLCRHLGDKAFEFWPRSLLGCWQLWSRDYHSDSKLKSPPNPLECPEVRQTTWQMPTTHHHPFAAIFQISVIGNISQKNCPKV